MKGNSFPVEIKYGPCLANKRIEESVKAVIRMHLHEGPGDILVFLTGSDECEKAKKFCLEKL
jgi:HrpA-like RNA helicase